VELHGYPELAAGSLVLFRKIDRDADAAFGRVADGVAGAVRGRVPHRTGRLAGSVEAQHGTDPGVGIGAGVPYAGWIEFGGTRGRPYVPTGRYLYPTALAAEPLLVAAGEITAQRNIGGMHWPTPI
jgi:hypothetical protein